MVSNKTIWILIVISVLLLGASLWISASYSGSGQEQINFEDGGGGNQDGSLNIVINPPAGSAENG